MKGDLIDDKPYAPAPAAAALTAGAPASRTADILVSVRLRSAPRLSRRYMQQVVTDLLGDLGDGQVTAAQPATASLSLQRQPRIDKATFQQR